MLASGSQLAQSRPSNTTAAAAYTATVRTEITLIVICNSTASSATARLFHDDDGSSYSEATAILYDVPIAANTTQFIDLVGMGSGIVVAPTGTIGVRTGTASALTFTLYGVTQGQTK